MRVKVPFAMLGILSVCYGLPYTFTDILLSSCGNLKKKGKKEG